jgi:transposase
VTKSTTSTCGLKPTVETRPVFAGIDFHKRNSVVTLGDVSGNLLLQESLENDVHVLRKFFLRHGPLKCAIENCRGHEWMVELLKQCGCEVVVGNTYAIKLISQSKKKDDKKDSKILMELCARGYLPQCYQPTPEERLLRERLRWRTKLMRSRTQYKNVSHALMDKENKGRKIGSRKARKAATELGGLVPDRQERLGRSLELVELLDRRVSLEDDELSEIANANPDVARLKTIPGVGDISALMLVAELGDVSRFKKARNVAGYFGLVPRLYASSDTRRLGSITKQGSGLMRRILIQDAWMAIRMSKKFRDKYNCIVKRRGKKVAAVAIARMIAEIAFRILKDQTVFDESKM